MKTFRAKNGPFSEQPFYEAAEIESICTEELQRLNLYPSDPAPIRIDRFIEKRFGVQPIYEDLPDGLLGFTRFGIKGVAEIVVTKALDDEGTTLAERRLRSTLAHEGGHGLLHAHLFAFGARPDSLFGNGLAPDALKILCREGASPASNAAKRNRRIDGGSSRQIKRWVHCFCRRRWWKRLSRPCWLPEGFLAFRLYVTTGAPMRFGF